MAKPSPYRAGLEKDMEHAKEIVAWAKEVRRSGGVACLCEDVWYAWLQYLLLRV